MNAELDAIVSGKNCLLKPAVPDDTFGAAPAISSPRNVIFSDLAKREREREFSSRTAQSGSPYLEMKNTPLATRAFFPRARASL